MRLVCQIYHLNTFYRLLSTDIPADNDPQEGTSNPLDTLTTDFVFQHIKLPTEEFLNQCSRQEESEQAQLFLDIFSSIPLCEWGVSEASRQVTAVAIKILWQGALCPSRHARMQMDRTSDLDRDIFE